MNQKPLLIVKSNNKYISNSIYFDQRKYKIINSNILEVEELKIEKINNDFSDYSIIITSINSIFAIKKLQIPINNKIFTVGQNSAKILENLDYKNVFFGQNSAQSLLDKIILENLINKSEKILYLCGEKITIDIAKKLQQQNYNIIKKVVYKIQSRELSEKIIAKLKNNIINDIAIFSKNGAEIFLNLCYKNQINLSSKKIHFISRNVEEFWKKSIL
jgi:uroporphyrinogen-III synthase